jgi:uncharacterized protein
MPRRTSSSGRSRKTARRPAATTAGQAPPAPRPRVVSMRPAACIAMLERHTVGRMAYTFRDRVGITPIHYVYSNGWLFARTSDGAKMRTIRHAPWVAFEVDEIRGVFSWKSVVAYGTVYTMAPDGGPNEVRLWNKGIELLKRIVPETGSERDPVPFRTLVFGIHVDTITGRSCSVEPA